MKYILALDQGTTSSRAILFDIDGRIREIAQKEFRQIFPHSGWVEHDPNEIWSSQSSVAIEALENAGVRTADLAAIGITNQRETAIVWDRATGAPVCNAIVWQDRRTSGLCEQLKAEGFLETFRARTGLLLDAYFSGTKVRWILDNVPEARAKAEDGRLAFGTVDSWLLWKLTGGQVHATDPSNASRTLLFNIHTGEWDNELLKILDIPRTMLPEVRSSSEVYGEVKAGKFAAGTPVAGIAGDQQAALFGQACTHPGMAKNTYGTGCFLLMNTGTEPVASKNNLLTTVAWKIDDRIEYALEGSIFIAGAVVQWLRDQLGVIRHSEEIEALAASVPDNGGCYMVPAFAGLGAPHWDPFARGAIFGLTRGCGSGHLARAALESIAYQSYDVLKAMQSDSGIALKELRVDGGASVNNLLMQFQADLLQTSVVRPEVTETTALGAAYLAGLATGFWEDRDTISRQWKTGTTFEPKAPAEEISRRLALWYKAVQRSQVWEAQA